MKARGGALGLIVVIGIVAIAGFSISTGFARDPGSEARRTLVIYPGDYVVQQGDLAADGQWLAGVRPSAVVIRPGDGVVQATDFDLLARWRIDVNSATGEVNLEAVDSIDGKAVVNPYLNVPFAACLDCNGNASTTRTIRISGTYNSSPLACVWSNPVIGWPSSYPGFESHNVASVDAGLFSGTIGPPYNNGDDFSADFVVEMAAWGYFGVYVDVMGDLTGPGCPP